MTFSKPPDMTSDADAEPVEKVDVADLLKSIAAGREIDWVLNPGNAGDSLIVAGTVQLLTSHDIPYRCIFDYDHYDGTDRIVCYSGGGCLVPYYTFAREFLARHHERAAHVVMLPHTIVGNEDLLGGFGRNVTLICREAFSYRHCRAAARAADVHVADDLAFRLDARVFLSRPSGPLGHRDEAVEVKMRERYRDFFLSRAVGRSALAVWRGDVERSKRRMEPAQHDIANTFGIESIYGPAAMLTSAEYFLRTVDQFQEIRTDRLHVAVAGALLGKRVEIYPNGYFKNRAMYDFSLRTFPGVTFVEWPAAAGVPSAAAGG
jgi:exopolysaccharide biosynthesis predicted pyruvyltransferase EpsI